MTEKTPKNQFQQIYEAFGFSPGGFTQDNIAYLPEDGEYGCSRNPDWKNIIDKLNADGVISAEKIVVVSLKTYEKLLTPNNEN